MKLLIDGDILVYRCGFAAETTEYFLYDADEEDAPPFAGPFSSAADRNAYVKEHNLDKDSYTIERAKIVEPLSHALANVKSVMSGILESLGTDEYVIALSSGKNFRDSIATIKKYKGNRDDADKPVHYDAIREYLREQWGAKEFYAIEADDVLAMLQEPAPKTCIVSIDKDLLQVPGLHYNWVKEEKCSVSPEVGIRKLFQQVLTGDSTDNIPGIRGVGDVTARKILADCAPDKDELYQACVKKWREYLDSDKSEKDGFWTIEEGVYGYYPWPIVDARDDFCVVGSGDIVDEVYSLVKVGGDYARKALESSGESLPNS